MSLFKDMFTALGIIFFCILLIVPLIKAEADLNKKFCEENGYSNMSLYYNPRSDYSGYYCFNSTSNLTPPSFNLRTVLEEVFK